jgi:AraC family transcriptional regulator, transcriptional activator of pobA
MENLFRIFEITKELAADLSSRPIEVHFHDFEELIIITEGSLEHFIDFKEEIVSAPFACYVSMGKVHRLQAHKNLRGWVINYKNEFIPDSKLNFYSNFFSVTNIHLSSDTCIRQFNAICQIIHDEYKQELADHTTIRYLVNSLISMLEAERKRNIPIESNSKFSQIETFNSFLKILEDNFRRDEGVSYYSNKMNMSERNLNNICKNNFQKSVSEIIETRKLIEAKRMLLYSDKTISEIGYSLGYNEKSYFTRVFHSKMGITPTRFREMTRNLIS